MMKKKVLYVEDNELVIDLVRDLLETETYEIEHYMTVDEGISAFSNRIFDIVLMDLHLKQTNSSQTTNGMDLLRHIRYRKKSKVPVVVMTGMELICPNDLLDHGATVFFHKHNINWDDFLAQVRTLTSL